MKVMTRADNCVHHWVIEEPAGETSNGVCQHCLQERRFSNGIGRWDVVTNTEHRESLKDGWFGGW